MLKLARHIDWVYLLIVSGLILIGLLMMFSASSVVGFDSYNNSYFFINRHIFYLFLGIGALIIGLAIDPEWYRKYALAGMGFSVVLLLLTLIPGVGVKVLGASRWLNLYVTRIQPVELAKFFIAVFLAVSLANKQDAIRNLKQGVFPILVVICVPIALLIQQPDLGNIGLILLVFITLVFLSKSRISHLMMFFGGGLGFLGISVWLHPYQLERIKTFLDPEKDPLGSGYNILQSLTAIGSGGLWGLGLGQSKIKYLYLPLQYSDFVFSIICEEGGFIFAVVVVSLYFCLFLRGVYKVCRAKDPYLFYLGMGLTLFLIYQAFINISVAVGLFPTTGIPLTFVSFGGTSLVCSLFYVGVLMRIFHEVGQ